MAGFGNVARLDDYRKTPTRYAEEEDAFEIPTDDGGVVIQFGMGNNPRDNEAGEPDDDGFDDNLADLVDPSALGSLAWQLLDGIQADEQSRTQWISDRTRGLDLLAVKIEQPRANIGGSGAPMDGMATVRHPLLLEACIRFQSNFKREMLPADGPVKIKIEGAQTAGADAQAEKFSDLFNRCLTEFRPEYYPDTDRMGFEIGFSGNGFKKVYHCPLRRMPVSDTVDAQDLIVSNDARDFRTALRITQKITMTKPMLKRMQFVGAYRDVPINMPDMMPKDRVTAKKARMQGIDPSSRRPQDQQHTIYECYTNVNLAGFEHIDDDGNETGLPLPYKITIEKSSRQILEIRRNWHPHDNDNFEPCPVFVSFPFVPMFGFYATGLLHILGNATQAVTGAWRILLDSGMFSNFPGFLYAKNGGRQDDLNFRVPPGGGSPVDLNGSEDIRKVIMALPYKEPGAATMELVNNIIETGARVGGTAEYINPQGIRQNMPVGTTMMLVEQAAQTVSAVHERCYVAQAREFQMLLELYREDPKAIWRHIEREGVWTYQELVQTLNTYTLVPVADPNTPTHIHRIMKMTTLKQLEQASPDLYDPKAVDMRILKSIKIDDPETLFAPPPPPGAQPPQDPAITIAQMTIDQKKLDIQAKMQIEGAKAALAAKKLELEHQIKMTDLELRQLTGDTANEVKMAATDTQARTADKDRESKEFLELTKLNHAASESQAGREHEGGMQVLNNQHAATEGQANRTAASDDKERDRQLKIAEGHATRSAAASEAEAGRQHEAEQAGIDRRHASYESQQGREHEGRQAALTRRAATNEATAGRAHEASESSKDRRAAASSAAADREFKGDQAGRDRQHASKLAASKTAAKPKPKKK